jgi:hypothetical protein
MTDIGLNFSRVERTADGSGSQSRRWRGWDMDGAPIWSVGFDAAERRDIAREAARCGAPAQHFDDLWGLTQAVSPCLGGALVRRPRVVVIDSRAIDPRDTTWYDDVVSGLPILCVTERQLQSGGGVTRTLRGHLLQPDCLPPPE